MILIQHRNKVKYQLKFKIRVKTLIKINKKIPILMFNNNN